MGDPREILTRPAPPPDATVAYGEDPLQLVDLHLPPPGAVTRPLVVFVHGGFWMAAYDRVHTRPLVADLVAHGHPVANIEFRRIGDPGGGWPGTLDDVAAAVAAAPRFVAGALAQRAALHPDQGGALHPDQRGALHPDRRGDDLAGVGRPVLAGHSAGGHLALWAGHRAGPGAVRGVLALAPVADLSRGYEMKLGGGAVRQLLGGSPAEVPDRYAYADPARSLPLSVPVVIVHGERDAQVPYEVGRDFAAAAGPTVRLVGLPDVEHFGLIDPRSAAWPAVLTALSSLDAAPDR